MANPAKTANLPLNEPDIAHPLAPLAGLAISNGGGAANLVVRVSEATDQDTFRKPVDWHPWEVVYLALHIQYLHRRSGAVDVARKGAESPRRGLHLKASMNDMSTERQTQ